MSRYFTKEFFDEVVNRLNADPEWSKKATAITARVVLTCVDRNASFLLDVANGRVSSSEAAGDVAAGFKVEGTFEARGPLGGGGEDFQELREGGTVRFRGSLAGAHVLSVSR